MSNNQQPTKTGARGTVTVICRLPSGLVMDLYDPAELKARAESTHPVMSTPRVVASVTLRGAKHDPRFHIRDNQLLGMGGRTEVDADFWDAWRAQNAHFLPLKNGLIFAQARTVDAEAELRERGADRTGLEGLDPNRLGGVEPLNAEAA